MPGRKYQATSTSTYRYSMNGQEKESELNENITTALYWEYDSRLVRRWNVDPKPQTSISPYNCFNGNSIFMVDPLGDQTRDWVGKKNNDGTYTPVWEESVLKKGDEKAGDIYLGKDKIVSATDGNFYHLRPDRTASKVKNPPKDKVDNTLRDASKPSPGSVKKPDSPSNSPLNTKPILPTEKPEEGDGSPVPQNGILAFPFSGRPDYIQVTGAWTTLKVISVGLSLTIDKNGVVYPGYVAGAGTKGLGLSITFNYIDNPSGSKDQLHNFLSGKAYSAGAGYGMGLVHSWSFDPKNKTTSSGWGIMNPQAGATFSNNPPNYEIQTNFKW